MEEIDDKAEVEIKSISDEIKSYIRSYKENKTISNYFSR